MNDYREYIDRINELNICEMTELIGHFSNDDRLYAESLARKITGERFGRKIYIRGLIEFTNVCRNDCFYCGIRCSSKAIDRFRLTDDEILSCCENGYRLGFRTFVLQGGEDPFYDDERMCSIIRRIRSTYPDCAITLSIGERSIESYMKMQDAGADRYLLRHETADQEHYARLHPENMKFEHRMKCLRDLHEIGYQTGCGFMVGSPYQTPETLARDLLFIRQFRPEMVGIGPFLPQSNTPFGGFPAGSVNLTLFLLSLIRIMLPDVLLPAATALGSAEEDGRIRGIMAGANVYMPNLSPEENRGKYLLYDNKAGLDDEAGHVLEKLSLKLADMGYSITVSRGDYGD